MKQIIDIDEDIRITISRMGLLRIPDEMQKKVDKAIQHGTPLDKIRAEIIEMTSDRGFLICSVDHIHEEINAVFDKYGESKK